MITDRNAAIDEIMAIINEKKTELDQLNRDIWEHPEIADQEFYALKRQEEFLPTLGFKFEKPYDDVPTAYIATRETGKGGKCFAFCAEYDALPVIGHGCGHNFNCVNAVSAGWGLAEYLERHNIPGKVIIFGTPAEEGKGGKVRMLRHGCLEGVDAVMMSHAGSNTNGHGNVSSWIHRYEVEFKGKASHAASNPWKGLNALDAQLLLFHAVALNRQQSEKTAIIHGIIKQGGDAVNVIPDHTVSMFSIRSTVVRVMETLIDRFMHMVQGAAEMTGTEATVREVAVPYMGRRTNWTLEEPVLEAFERYGMAVDHKHPAPGDGSSDFGDFSQTIPGGYPKTAVSLTPVPGHSIEKREACNTDYSREQCRKSGAGMAFAGLIYLTDADFRAKVQEEFEKNA